MSGSGHASPPWLTKIAGPVSGTDRIGVCTTAVPIFDAAGSPPGSLRTARCRKFAALGPEVPVEEVLTNPAVLRRVREGMSILAQGAGSSTYPTRVMLMAEPPSVEAGEITDKGYINQRIVRTRRADLVQWLHADVPDKNVITVHAPRF